MPTKKELKRIELDDVLSCKGKASDVLGYDFSDEETFKAFMVIMVSALAESPYNEFETPVEEVRKYSKNHWLFGRLSSLAGSAVADYYRAVLEEVYNNPDISIDDIEIMAEEKTDIIKGQLSEEALKEYYRDLYDFRLKNGYDLSYFDDINDDDDFDLLNSPFGDFFND